jgi:hypothetical protein
MTRAPAGIATAKATMRAISTRVTELNIGERYRRRVSISSRPRFTRRYAASDGWRQRGGRRCKNTAPAVLFGIGVPASLLLAG